MNHSIKYNRVKKLSQWGKFHRTFEAKIAELPEFVWDKLSAAEIVELLDAMSNTFSRGKNEGWNDAREAA